MAYCNLAQKEITDPGSCRHCLENPDPGTANCKWLSEDPPEDGPEPSIGQQSSNQPAKKLWVRITRYSGDGYWYKHSVGKEFEVTDNAEIMGLPIKDHYVLAEDENKFIDKSDCTIIEPESEQQGEGKVIEALTDIMREADIAFETVGGGTRHYVRDCFLPLLEERGFTIHPSPAPIEQPTVEDKQGEREEKEQGWDMAMTFANNLLVQISDDYNNDDQSVQADVTSYCAKCIRKYIGQYPPEIREPATGKPIEEAKFPYDYKSLPLKGGGQATVTGEVTPELTDALNAMVDAAKHMKKPIEQEKREGEKAEEEESIQDLFDEAERAMVKLLPPDDFEQDDDCTTLHYNLNELKFRAIRYQSTLTQQEATIKDLQADNARLRNVIIEKNKEIDKAEDLMLEAGVIVKPSEAFKKTMDAIESGKRGVCPERNDGEHNYEYAGTGLFLCDCGKWEGIDIRPRRMRLDLNEPAELAIYNAIQGVEKLGADLRLTNAVVLLLQAKDLVSDFIDEQLKNTSNG